MHTHDGASIMGLKKLGIQEVRADLAEYIANCTLLAVAFKQITLREADDLTALVCTMVIGLSVWTEDADFLPPSAPTRMNGLADLYFFE